MSRKDAEALLRQARRQGMAVTLTGSGHWKVTNPATGQATVLSGHPGRTGIRDVRVGLRRVGLR